MNIAPTVWSRAVASPPLLIASTIASGEQAKLLPSDVDLKAAYCIDNEQSDIDYQNQQIAKALANHEDADLVAVLSKVRDKSVEDLHHLQRYLLPRLKYLDTLGLRLAAEQAKSDRALSGKLAEQCASEKPTRGDLGACIKESDAALFNRVSQCGDLSWLPF